MCLLYQVPSSEISVLVVTKIVCEGIIRQMQVAELSFQRCARCCVIIVVWVQVAVHHDAIHGNLMDIEMVIEMSNA